MDSYSLDGPTEDQVINWAEHNAHADPPDYDPDEVEPPETDEEFIASVAPLLPPAATAPASRVFRISRHSWEVTPDELERRWTAGYGPVDDIKPLAVEVAPGIKVALMSTGDGIAPDGQVHRGAQIAVWTSAASVPWMSCSGGAGPSGRPMAA